MEKVCLDTDIVIDYLLNKEDIVKKLLVMEKNADCAITPLVLFELFSIAEASEKREENTKIIAELAQRITMLEWTPYVCAKAAKSFAAAQKAKKKIELRDLFVALLTTEHKYMLFTGNPEAYKEIPEVKIYK